MKLTIDGTRYLIREVAWESPRILHLESEDGESQAYWGHLPFRRYEKVTNLEVNEGGIITYAALESGIEYFIDNGVEIRIGRSFRWPPRCRHVHFCEEVRDRVLLPQKKTPQVPKPASLPKRQEESLHEEHHKRIREGIQAVAEKIRQAIQHRERGER